MVSQQQREARPPDMVLEFAPTTYNESIMDHYRFRDWLIFAGMAFRNDYCAVLHGPRHDGEKPPRVMGEEWDGRIAQSTKWQITADFWTKDPETSAMLQALVLPERARWRIAEWAQYEAEYERLFRWRDRWMRLSNKPEPGRLQTRQEAIERRARIANERIGALMRRYDAARGKRT